MRTQTFAQLVDKYIAEELDASSSNYKTRLGQLKWWSEQLGHLPLIDIKEDVISSARKLLLTTNDRYGFPRGKATVNRYMTTLSILFRVAAKEWRLVTYNPVTNFQKFKEPSGRDRFLAEYEIERLLKACRNSSNQNLFSIVMLALSTGMRKGEIMNLKWRDIDFQGGLIKLERTKNGDKRYVPLKEPIFSILVKQNLETAFSLEDYVFQSRGGGKPLDFRLAWRKALQEAEIKNFVFHSLRATCVTYLSKLGYPLHVIAKIVGHREITTTFTRYVCLGLNEHAIATEKLGQFLKNF